MKNKQLIYVISVIFVLILVSACGSKANSVPTETTNTEPTETNQGNNAADNPDSINGDQEILIIIDQTPKPIEGNSFDFVVNQVPEGFSLSEMQWISEENLIVNSIQEAIQHGANGEDGFYISGNGQFSGFIYSDTMKGEEGEIVFLFKNEQGTELTWKKKLTLIE
ncbi:hypothetical protein BK133_03515 [Paenibacillus sp. FSL H8-0548]|uniref:hypothetical protein n=1 Tax=Paenibacillus sp. FSL H8-0548 TaxID=1920422 RepID=UPI00096F6FE7|nr:hypothetical protein [Paenibacillus sp. FSL H8-0548]OMF38058.1 hypothetical protein BK133_03515 [Paenibacillus sp. FSL H8-0548]